MIVPEDIKYELLYNLEMYAHYSAFIRVTLHLKALNLPLSKIIVIIPP